MTQLEKVLYTAKTHTTGGRDGAARSSDGRLDIKLSSPGAAGNGTNPEQLFPAGWSACFMGAMGLAARKMKVTIPHAAAVDAEVDLGTTDGQYLLVFVRPLRSMLSAGPLDERFGLLFYPLLIRIISRRG